MVRWVVSLRVPVFGLLIIIPALAVLGSGRAAAQWQVQAGYSRAFQDAPKGATIQVQRLAAGSSTVRLHLRAEGHMYRARVERRMSESIDRVVRANLVPLVELRLAEIGLRGGLAVGLERYRFKWLTCPPRQVVILLTCNRF